MKVGLWGAPDCPGWLDLAALWGGRALAPRFPPLAVWQEGALSWLGNEGLPWWLAMCVEVPFL